MSDICWLALQCYVRLQSLSIPNCHDSCQNATCQKQVRETVLICFLYQVRQLHSVICILFLQKYISLEKIYGQIHLNICVTTNSYLTDPILIKKLSHLITALVVVLKIFSFYSSIFSIVIPAHISYISIYKFFQMYTENAYF